MAPTCVRLASRQGSNNLITALLNAARKPDDGIRTYGTMANPDLAIRATTR